MITRIDDRTEEEKEKTLAFVVGTDRFLSGWGNAPGRSIYALPILDPNTSHVVLENMQNRSDMQRVRYVMKDYKPKLRNGDHYKIASPAMAERHYRKGGF